MMTNKRSNPYAKKRNNIHVIENNVIQTPCKSNDNTMHVLNNAKDTDSNVLHKKEKVIVPILSPPSVTKPINRTPSKKRKTVSAIDYRKIKKERKDDTTHSKQATITTFMKKNANQSNKYITVTLTSIPVYAHREKYILSLPDKNMLGQISK